LLHTIAVRLFQYSALHVKLKSLGVFGVTLGKSLLFLATQFDPQVVGDRF